MAEHNDFGHQGEVLAQNLLTQKGYKIIDTNWRYGHNEVDIIAQKDDIIVVCLSGRGDKDMEQILSM